jgi:threonine dehydrogenase-like Zn-dependent dehydrogenase
MKAVQIDGYGGVEVLDVREVERPEPGPNQVLVAVRAAGINPSEWAMRTGRVRVSGKNSQRTYAQDDVRAAFTELEAGHDWKDRPDRLKRSTPFVTGSRRA